MSQIGRRESKFQYKYTCLHTSGWGRENVRGPDNDILLTLSILLLLLLLLLLLVLLLYQQP